MKNLVFKINFFALCGLLFVSSCSKDEAENGIPEEMIVGTWAVTSGEILGETIPGDGSTLTFNSCDTECTGSDYLASDETTGSIRYSFNEDFTTITIVDNSADGGNYDGTWDILELSNSDLHLKTETFLGTFEMELKK